MAEFPYLPMWTDAYLADTTHLRTEEHGAYLLLLFAAWRNTDGSLPDDDTILSRLAGVSTAKWRAMKPVIMGFWSLDKRKKKWTQKRLQDERKKALAKKAKARDSARSRWKDHKNSDANALRAQCSPEPEPYEKPTGFSRRAGAQKPRGFVEVRKTTDAINDLIEEIRNDADRIGIDSEGNGGDVPVLPAIRAVRS